MEPNKKIEQLFVQIEWLTNANQCESFESLLNDKINSTEKDNITRKEHNYSRPPQWQYIEILIEAVTELSDLIKDNTSLLISVKNQKLLRCSYQLITSLGLLPCLIPGVGIKLNIRSANSSKLPPMNLDDTEKYILLKQCTDFFISSYNVPVLKNIILTMHLADYLAALIQLSYAPLKKPGIYIGFTMTQDMYEQLQADRTKYVPIYEKLVSTCFQPMIMKELLVLQSGTDPSPPLFLKRVTSKELSKRLLNAGGLLSLIRCFIDSQSVDVGYDWKKIDMIRRIVGTKHGPLPDEVYTVNICRQLTEIISSSDIRHYSTAAACILHLSDKYPQSAEVKELVEKVFKCFDLKHLEKKSSLPGTILLTSQEIEHNINVLHSVCTMHLNESHAFLYSNVYVLFLMRLKCSKFEKLKEKLDNLIMKHLEQSANEKNATEIKQLLFGDNCKMNIYISIEEYDSGIVLKRISENSVHPIYEASKYIVSLLKNMGNANITGNIFEICLQTLLALTDQRKQRANQSLLELEDRPEVIRDLDVTYAVTLQLLEELSAIPQVLSFITNNPEYVIQFIETVLLKTKVDDSNECVTIALVFLNTLLAESSDFEVLKNRCSKIVPALRQMCLKDSDNTFLANEILTLITDEKSTTSNKKSEFGLVVSSIFDNLLPVRAHGLMELTKLIERKDTETLSKKHYVMCLFQEHLKDEDSYIYLSAINGIAALGQHSTEDVLNMLCKEFLEISTASIGVETVDMVEKRAQLRMKVGDVIVKVTRNLGEMAVVHKALLLNTILCACRDDDPLIRASALSNMAEIALVLHYRLGNIIYEILLSICSVLDTDKSIECRRAAVMVIASLLKGLGKETLLQLQDNLLPVYRMLKKLYHKPDQDPVVRLHSQIALEELNDIVKDFIFPKIDMEWNINADIDKINIKYK